MERFYGIDDDIAQIADIDNGLEDDVGPWDETSFQEEIPTVNATPQQPRRANRFRRWRKPIIRVFRRLTCCLRSQED